MRLLSNVSAEAGELVKLECHVGGVPTPDLEWTQNNQIIHDSRSRVVKFDGQVATLVIFEYAPSNAGKFVGGLIRLADHWRKWLDSAH